LPEEHFPAKCEAVRRRKCDQQDNVGIGELLAQFADEDVDDLQLRLVHAAIEVIEEHFLGQRRALAQAQELQHLVLLAGQVHAGAVDLDGLGVEVDDEIAGVDDRLGVALGAAQRMSAFDPKRTFAL
jgi:hypothetical protein